MEKSFQGGVHALRGLSISVARGEVVALVGPNGSGKTTLLRILAGDVEADRGTVKVLGLAAAAPTARAQVGFATQSKALDPESTGLEALTLFHALRGLPREERSEGLAGAVEEFGLGSFAHRRIGGYSGGQKRRLHLALETLHEPQVLLFDEPTGDLDPDGRRNLWRQIGRWRGDGKAILIATHDLEPVSRWCDRAVVLSHGKVLADDTPSSLVSEHGRARSVLTLSDTPKLPGRIERLVTGLTDVVEVQLEEETMTLWRRSRAPSSEPAVAILQNGGVGVSRLELRDPDLASAYFSLSRHEEVVSSTRGAPENEGSET